MERRRNLKSQGVSPNTPLFTMLYYVMAKIQIYKHLHYQSILVITSSDIMNALTEQIIFLIPAKLGCIVAIPCPLTDQL